MCTEYGTERDESDRRESDSEKSEKGPLKEKPALAKKALKLANEQLRRSTRQKNPVVRFGYKEYMVHHYAYMMLVAEVHDPESYTEATKDANWRAAMEEEMRALAENKTWDLVGVQGQVQH